MSDREALIQDTLLATRWADWARSPLASDASSRRYLRLTQGEKSVILMDADPKTGQDTRPFAEIGNWLRDQKFIAPETLFHDKDHGIMVISDLGQHDFARHITAHPVDENLLYCAAIDVLAELDSKAAPDGLATMTPEVGGEMVAITTQWYAKCDGTDLIEQVTKHLAHYCGPADHVALRDFHAENLIWRPHETGTDRVGLLDYQDAFLAPRGYDLVSLLRDVRRTVDTDLAADMTNRFLTATRSSTNTLTGLKCLAVQRNLRILGVFSRLARQDGKTKYIAMIPHIWSMIIEDIAHPALNDLQKSVLATLPPPEDSDIRGLL